MPNTTMLPTTTKIALLPLCTARSVFMEIAPTRLACCCITRPSRRITSMRGEEDRYRTEAMGPKAEIGELLNG
jgi:hypothetical protein